MIPMALSIGLEIPVSFPTGRMPTREVMEGKRLRPQEQVSPLRPDEVYIGSGHHSHRQPVTKWASPFAPGRHGTEEECLIMYVQYLHESRLAEKVHELFGKTLLCDNPLDKPAWPMF